MTTKNKAKNRILDAVYETAGDLYRLGFIGQRKLRQYDLLCLEPTSDCGTVACAAERCDKGTT